MRPTCALKWTLLLHLSMGTAFADQTVCQFPCPPCPEVKCQEGVGLVLDGCQCCPICSRQHGQSCSAVQLCDATKPLVCDVTGVCRGRNFSTCVVNDTSYTDGQTFQPDCRTQCTCQDGSYACTSLCPHEMIPPSRRCKNPTLVDVRGQCCRQWMCANGAPATPPSCEPLTSDWSPCSVTCGGGVSTRISNRNKDCILMKETRLCQIRECPLADDTSWNNMLYRMMTEDDKVCHPTQRAPVAVHLRWSNCSSVHRHRPRFCSDCRRHCCRPAVTFTRSLPFVCDLERPAGLGDHLWRLGDGVEPPAPPGPHWARVVQPVMWVKECVCESCEARRNEESVEGHDKTAGNRKRVRISHWEGLKSLQLRGGDIDGDEPL